MVEREIITSNPPTSLVQIEGICLTGSWAIEPLFLAHCFKVLCQTRKSCINRSYSVLKSNSAAESIMKFVQQKDASWRGVQEKRNSIPWLKSLCKVIQAYGLLCPQLTSHWGPLEMLHYWRWTFLPQN